jgi:capsular polysaccharide biosynthesis protein
VTDNKERFVLYEYLLFFWKKKWLFVILPIVTLLLGALLSMLQSANYTGKAIVYVGDLSGGIKDPVLVQNKYSNIDRDISLNVKVDQPDQITFTVKGDDKDKVDDILADITSSYYDDLETKSKKILQITDDGIKLKTERAKILDDILKTFSAQIDTGNLDEEEQARLVEYEDNLLELTESILRMEKDINTFEKPEIIKEEVNSDPKNIRTNMILGFVAGIFLTILSLIVWKYILNARRFYNHD